MSTPIRTASIPAPSVGSQAPAPMQVLTLDETRAVVGGPVIDNGGISVAAAATPSKD